jgi:hypothetical protein
MARRTRCLDRGENVSRTRRGLGSLARPNGEIDRNGHRQRQAFLCETPALVDLPLLNCHYWARDLGQYLGCSSARQMRRYCGCRVRSHHKQIGTALLCRVNDAGSGLCAGKPGLQ